MVISTVISTQLLKKHGFGRLIKPFRENGLLEDPTKWTERRLGSILPKIGLTEAETEKFFESFDRNYTTHGTVTFQPLDQKLERARDFYRSVTSRKPRIAEKFKMDDSDDTKQEYYQHQRRKIAILSKHKNCQSDMEIFYHLLEEKSSLKGKIKTLKHLLEMSQEERQKICPTVDLRRFTELLKTYKETKIVKMDLEAGKEKTFGLLRDFEIKLKKVSATLEKESCTTLQALTTRAQKLQKNVQSAKAKIECMQLQRKKNLKSIQLQRKEDLKKFTAEKQRLKKDMQAKFEAEKLIQTQKLKAKFEADMQQLADDLKAKYEAKQIKESQKAITETQA